MELLSALREEGSVTEEMLSREVEMLCADPEDGQLIRQVMDDLLADALISGASDIHIDQTREAAGCWVSFRIDGELRYRYLLSPEAIAPVVTRIKGEAGLDFSEKRRPQDGRLGFTFRGRQIDVRVASLPIDGGEAVTLRLLDPTRPCRSTKCSRVSRASRADR